MENMNLSDRSKEALKSETWQEAREVSKEKIIMEYMQTGYAGEDKQHDISVSGTTYKVLDRGEITTFYDAMGNTLFSVENKELTAKYEEMAKSGSKPDPADEEVAAAKLAAKEKLEKEMKADKDKTFAEPVIGYLLKRCEEDAGLAQDVMQEHKTWNKCFDYIFEQARKQAKGNSAAVRDDVVYEWAEDYYRKDDKAEEEKKAKKAAERKKKEEEHKKEAAERKKADKKNPQQAAKKEEKTEEKTSQPPKTEIPKEAPKQKKNGKDMDGQLDMFAMMGM